MLKTINIEIDGSTWPATSSGSPSLPAGFKNGTSSYNLDVLSTLLVIGQLTTPTTGRGATLSEFWAWVRYASAVAGSADLRLTRAFADLDSHQKTILSDDFGMGVPITWLINSLDLVSWCDGAYFRERLSALLATPPPPTAKKGRTKSPDFVVQDSSGRLHVVECKGTQGAAAKREAQFFSVDAKGRASGGRVQKRALTIHSSIAGQRLVCGLLLAHETAKHGSSVKVVDPELASEAPQGIEAALWTDPIVRSSLSKALRSSGLPASADAVAIPSGRVPSSRATGPDGSLRERSRRDHVEARRIAAREEIAVALARAAPRDTAMGVVGREAIFSSPVLLSAGGLDYRSLTVRQGMRREFLERLAEEGFVDAPIHLGAPWLLDAARGLKLSTEKDPAGEEALGGGLMLGSAFVSTMRLTAASGTPDR